MSQLSVGDYAPDFVLPNCDGAMIRLSDVYQSQNVFLVFNLGFA